MSFINIYPSDYYLTRTMSVERLATKVDINFMLLVLVCLCWQIIKTSHVFELKSITLLVYNDLV